MVEVWRTNAETSETSTNVTATEDAAVAANIPEPVPELPATGAPASNPGWNRSAEAVGRSVGTAVSEVRRLPRRLGDLRSRIHLVEICRGCCRNSANQRIRRCRMFTRR